MVAKCLACCCRSLLMMWGGKSVVPTWKCENFHFFTYPLLVHFTLIDFINIICLISINAKRREIVFSYVLVAVRSDGEQSA